ncbi:Dystroglycan, partial [Gryllus bimaculatus]
GQPDGAAAAAAAAPPLPDDTTRHLPTSPILYAGTIMSTPVLVPVRPTRLGGPGPTPDDGGLLQPSRVYTQYAEVTPSATPVFYTE